MYSKKSQTSILLIDTFAEDNSQYAKHYCSNSYSGTLYFHDIYVFVSGQSNFNNNYGSVLVGLDSSITISGETNFTNNTGIIGPAIQLQGNGYLTFNNSEINFLLTIMHSQKEVPSTSCHRLPLDSDASFPSTIAVMPCISISLTIRPNFLVTQFISIQ